MSTRQAQMEARRKAAAGDEDGAPWLPYHHETKNGGMILSQNREPGWNWTVEKKPLKTVEAERSARLGPRPFFAQQHMDYSKHLRDAVPIMDIHQRAQAPTFDEYGGSIPSALRTANPSTTDRSCPDTNCSVDWALQSKELDYVSPSGKSTSRAKQTASQAGQSSSPVTATPEKWKTPVKHDADKLAANTQRKAEGSRRARGK